jgi:hypothetical protein
MEICPLFLSSVLHVNYGDNGEYIKALYDFRVDTHIAIAYKPQEQTVILRPKGERQCKCR